MTYRLQRTATVTMVNSAGASVQGSCLAEGDDGSDSVGDWPRCDGTTAPSTGYATAGNGVNVLFG